MRRLRGPGIKISAVFFGIIIRIAIFAKTKPWPCQSGNEYVIMKGMMKFLAMACIVFAVSSCGSSDKPDVPDGPVVTGEGIGGYWKLTSWSPATDFPKEVYLELDANNNTFVLYQNISSVGMEKLQGTFSYDSTTGKISGTYSDGSAWTYASYTITGDLKTKMVWTADSSTTDVTTYTRIDKIPDDVINETRALVSSGVRFL